MEPCPIASKENPIKEAWTNLQPQLDLNDCGRQSGNVHLKDALGKVCPSTFECGESVQWIHCYPSGK